MEPRNFSEALNRLIDVGRDISTHLPLNRNLQPPYWIKCFDAFSHAVTLQTIQVFNRNKIPEDQRFEKLKGEFASLYDLFLEEFSGDLVVERDGKKISNDSWLRIEESDFEEDDQSKKDEPIKNDSLYSGQSSNRGLSIVIKKKEKGTKMLDIEFPISEMFEAAIALRKSGCKKPHYPYSVLYGIYKCIIFAVPDHISKMDEIATAIFPYTEKEGNILDQRIKEAKRYIKPLIDSNKDVMGGLLDKVIGGIDEIPDDQITEIAEQAQKRVVQMEKSDGTMASMFADFLPGSADEIAEKMEGVDTDNIRAMIDRAGSGKITNEELIASIPSLGDILDGK